MGETKQINIKNRTYYFYNNIIDLKHFDANLLKIDKKLHKNLDIYYIGYVTIKKIESIYSANLLYLHIIHAREYIEEKNVNKYLIFDSVDKNKEVLKKYAGVWDGIKNKIKAISGDKQNDYGKDYMKIKFNSDDDLPLKKLLKFYLMTINIRCVFSENSKFYPQLFLLDSMKRCQVFGRWDIMCGVCVCIFLKLLKCEKCTREKTVLIFPNTY